MGVGSASLMALPTTLNPALCIPASLPSCTLCFCPSPLLSSPAISRRNAEKVNSAPLFSYGRRAGCGFLVSASERRRRRSDGVGAADSVADDDGDEWEEEAEEDEEEETLPFQEMRRWLRSKPTGFGEGKTYDTTVEEKLIEEMEQSRKAQLENVNKLRNGSKNTDGSNKQEPEKEEVEVAPSGIRVRVCNLPRKKNIQRDLQLAFKGFPGIVNISPAVTGNRKTRDPICKGFAFLDLESEDIADRFVQKYSKQNVVFGKIEKQITCDIVNPQQPSNSTEQLTNGTRTLTHPRLTELPVETPERSEIIDLSLDSQGRTFSEGFTSIAVDDDGLETAIEYSDISLSNNPKNRPPVNGDDLGSNDSASSLQKPRKQAASRKKIVKTKSVKTSKSSVSGSMARLKIKERNVLTGVFSKYGGKAAPDLSKRS